MLRSTRASGPWFGALHALKSIDLAIADGERIIVSPPWEPGPSTLIRRVERLALHHERRIVADDVELTRDLLPAEKARIEAGMVLQSFLMFPHLAALDNFCHAPVWVKRMSRAEADALVGKDLDRVPIRECALESVGWRSASRRQQQVAVARALCVNPRLILVDEPTSELDPSMSKQVVGVMVNLAVLGMAIWRCRA